MRQEKVRTWNDNWNDVIRHVLFKDEKLKTQMLIPEDVSVQDFIEKYFIRDVSPDEVITTEKVRVSHYDTQGGDTGNVNVKRKYKEFDIFVHESELHTADTDRLRSRAELIAERIKYLLLREKNICGLRFSYEDEYDPLASNGDGENIRKSVYNYNELRSSRVAEGWIYGTLCICNRKGFRSSCRMATRRLARGLAGGWQE